MIIAHYVHKPSSRRVEIRHQGMSPGFPPDMRIDGPDVNGWFSVVVADKRSQYPAHVVARLLEGLKEMVEATPAKWKEDPPQATSKGDVTLVSNADEETFTMLVRHGETVLTLEDIDSLRKVLDASYHAAVLQSHLKAQGNPKEQTASEHEAPPTIIHPGQTGEYTEELSHG